MRCEMGQVYPGQLIESDPVDPVKKLRGSPSLRALRVNALNLALDLDLAFDLLALFRKKVSDFARGPV